MVKGATMETVLLLRQCPPSIAENFAVTVHDMNAVLIEKQQPSPSSPPALFLNAPASLLPNTSSAGIPSFSSSFSSSGSYNDSNNETGNATEATEALQPGKKALVAAADMSQLLDGYVPPPSSTILLED
jgi:hypothetical protein